MKLKTTLIAAAAALVALPAAAAEAAPKAKLRFATTTVVAGEGSSHAVVTVTRQPRNGKAKSTLTSAVSVNYSTSAGTAGASDYTDVSGTLNFASGDASESFLVPIIQDADIEGPETVNLALSAPSRNAVLVNPATATLTISDDDGPVQLSFSAPSYSVSEFGPTAQVTVVRTGQLRDGAGNNPVTSTVAYATANGTATNADYTPASGTLTFGPDEIEKTISIDINNDSAVEGSEAFSVNLSAPTNAAFANGAPTLSAPVTIIDDDTVSGNAELSFSSASYAGAENGPGIAVTVVRSGPVKSAISAAIKTADISAAAGTDYEMLDDIVDFDEGDITQTLVLPVIDDSVDESDETFSVGLSSPSGGLLGSPSNATLTILDNDETPIVVEVPAEQPAPEPGTETTNVTNVTNVTNTTTTVIDSRMAEEPGITVLGSRLGGCKLTVGTFKSQRIMRLKLVRVKLHAIEACTGSVKAHVTGRKARKGERKGAVRTKVAKFNLKAGQTRTLKLRFTKKGYALLKRALGARKSLGAALLVRSVNPAQRVTLHTLRWRAKR